MSQSIVEDAKKRLKQISLVEKKVISTGTIKGQPTIDDIRFRFQNDILTLPVAAELICYSKSINLDNPPFLIANTITAERTGITFFKKDLGEKSHLLMQKEVADTESDGKIRYDYYAYAVLFKNIYGLDIYFVPYTEKTHGFATVIFDEKGNKLRFNTRDIAREDAVIWVAEYLQKQERKK